MNPTRSGDELSLPSLISRQIAWAGDRAKRGHVLERLDDNLLAPLHPATYADFLRGSGDELGMGGGRAPKMSSLRSSSVLACNVFDPWRGLDLAPLSDALQVVGPFTELGFEQRLPHGLQGIPPNMDVVLYGRDTSPVGIESKFGEPYGKRRPTLPLADKYFPKERQRWTELGFPGL